MLLQNPYVPFSIHGAFTDVTLTHDAMGHWHTLIPSVWNRCFLSILQLFCCCCPNFYWNMLQVSSSEWVYIYKKQLGLSLWTLSILYLVFNWIRVKEFASNCILFIYTASRLFWNHVHRNLVDAFIKSESQWDLKQHPLLCPHKKCNKYSSLHGNAHEWEMCSAKKVKERSFVAKERGSD